MNPRTQTPVANTIIVTVVISVIAAFVPLDQLAEATSIGTLAAFAIVNFGVIALWRNRPELPRSFKVPLLPLVPVLGVVFCVYLISSLAPITWAVFFAWMALGLLLYMGYSRHHSQAPAQRPAPIPDEQAATELRTRGLAGGTVTGAVLLVLVAGAAVWFGARQPDLAGWQIGLWWLVVVTALGGAGVAVQALGQHQRALHAGADVTAVATRLRASVLTVALALVVPGVLAVLALSFASRLPVG